MTNRERLHKVLDLEGLRIQPVNKTLLQVEKATSKKKQGYLKCVTDDLIAEGLIDAALSDDKGLIGFMVFVPKSEFMKMYENEDIG